MPLSDARSRFPCSDSSQRINQGVNVRAVVVGRERDPDPSVANSTHDATATQRVYRSFHTEFRVGERYYMGRSRCVLRSSKWRPSLCLRALDESLRELARMCVKSTPSQRRQVVECRRQAGHRDVGHRRLREASRIGGEMQACGFEVKGAVGSKPAREWWILLKQAGRDCGECNTAVTPQPLVSAGDNRIRIPTPRVYLQDSCRLGRVHD